MIKSNHAKMEPLNEPITRFNTLILCTFVESTILRCDNLWFMVRGSIIIIWLATRSQTRSHGHLAWSHSNGWAERERERERELASKGGSVPHVNGRRVYSIRACTASMPSEGQLRYSLGTVSIMSVRKHTQPSGTELLVPWSWSMRPELICA